mgnify:FL=1
MSTLSIIGWLLLILIWTSMYVRNKKVKQDVISKDTAYAWALANLIASIVGLTVFIIDLIIKYA